jgi:hypothetical protein
LYVPPVLAVKTCLFLGLSKRFFFEKKKQKTFTHWSLVDRQWHRPKWEKSFFLPFP